MSTHTYTFLPEQSQEDALHATRLLVVEERPFQRARDRLLGPSSPLKPQPPRQLPSPPPEGNEAGSNEAETEPTESLEALTTRHNKLREEILLDFAALESSIVRMQMTLASNTRERERLAATNAKIVAEGQGVRENTVQLRAQLVEAKKRQEARQGYDKLAAELIDPRKLKSRAETREEIGRLEKEIEDLELEGQEVEGVWVGRREAFERVVAEGANLVRVIKGIKDEPEMEKDEEMEDGEDGPGTKGERSRMGTPLLEGTPMPGERTPMHRDGTPAPGGSTPVPGDMGSQTPMVEGEERPTNKFLDVEGLGTGVSSSRAESPALQPSEGQDVEMEVEKAELENAGDEVKEMMEMETIEEPATGGVATPAEDMDES